MHTTSLGRPASLRAIVVVSLRALMATPVQGETSRRAPTAHETSLRLVISNSMIEASQRFHLPVRWLRAVMRAESDADIGAVSKKGAIGLMQIMPETYAGLGNYPRAASQSARGSGGPATTRSAIASALYGRAA
ncbi:transglycosylase SLT domain-containing protein [Methylocystis sp. MJC1]|uniref:transglycosylase SLT domain-containing protein n=1 Tax=Methylocystis sp. MJC1 TaxID=2654282 RepID=UPI0020A6B6B8|nr:transglycosylase SLT domain-containing protein [Methylocystis sp. MJC1]